MGTIDDTIIVKQGNGSNNQMILEFTFAKIER